MKSLALKRANLSVTEAAGVPLVALTAWQALVEESSPARRPYATHLYCHPDVCKVERQFRSWVVCLSKVIRRRFVRDSSTNASMCS